MKRSRLKPGRKSLERGDTFAQRGKALKRGDGLKRSRLGRGRPRGRSEAEKAAAELFHAAGRAKNGGRCVKCGGPAGLWAHHAPEKQWLRQQGLADRQWDVAIACPVDDCHDRHTTGVDRITRDDLIRAEIWPTLVAWASRLDAERFPGRSAVLSRLEREYPGASE